MRPGRHYAIGDVYDLICVLIFHSLKFLLDEMLTYHFVILFYVVIVSREGVLSMSQKVFTDFCVEHAIHDDMIFHILHLRPGAWPA